MNSFAPHFEILPEQQRALWERLAPCSGLGFVLYGGTAIALQLGHRSSVDFDFFSHLPLNEAGEDMLLEALPFLGSSQLIQKSANTRSYITDRGVKLSFFGSIGFGRVGEPLRSDDGVLQVASLTDLMGTKLAVVMQRVEAKDYRDIAAMLRSGMSLEMGLACASVLYGFRFPPSESVRAITYFHGGDLDQLGQADKDTLLAAAGSLKIQSLPEVELLSRELTGDYNAGVVLK